MKKNGFTLIELLAVIVILGIILVIAIPSISKAILNSRKSAYVATANEFIDGLRLATLTDASLLPSSCKNLSDIKLEKGSNTKSPFGKNYTSDSKVCVNYNSETNEYDYSVCLADTDGNGINLKNIKEVDKLDVLIGGATCAIVNNSDYDITKGVNKPKLASGMTPIKWSGTEWVTTTENDSNWYDYTNKDWANAKTADGSMWVWIPRYEYKIPIIHSSTAQTILIKFLNGTSTTATSEYIIHPAFTFGATELTGIWVAKFEASGTTGAIDIKPNVQPLTNIIVNTMFTACRNMETNSRYGWDITGAGIDTHLMKNVEWGAVAYLSSSAYGKTSEVWINPASNYYTGKAGTSASSTGTTTTYAYNTTNGVNASTTGNIYGVYDMSGGVWEYTAAYINNGNSILTTNGLELTATSAKYKDMYIKGSNDDNITNYNETSTKFGDALYEISTDGGNTNPKSSWYTDYSYIPYSIYPFILRGGAYYDGYNAGIFAFSYDAGVASIIYGFRPIIMVDSTL